MIGLFAFTRNDCDDLMNPITRPFLLLTMACVLPSLGGCATPKTPASCAGLTGVRAVPVVNAQGQTVIRFTYTDDAMRLPHLQCRADLGERRAVVDLARVYETGAGLGRDDRRAAELYEKAAQDRPTVTAVYSPPVRLGGSGQMLFIPTPGGGPGDAEAKYRLGRMHVEGRGVTLDEERGQALMKDAVRQGFRDNGQWPERR